MNKKILDAFSNSYKYGFQTKIKKEYFPKGLSENIVNLISEKKKEPTFLKNFRLNSFKKWNSMSMPDWANLKVEPINFDEINYYSVQKKKV